MKNKEKTVLFSLTSCEELTNKVCEELGMKKSCAIVRRFADNEVFARPCPDVDVKGNDEPVDLSFDAVYDGKPIIAEFQISNIEI